MVNVQTLSFGGSFHANTIKLYAYRSGLEFGFNEIAFDQHGWLKRPAFLDTEDLKFGDTSRYGNHSSITPGHGITILGLIPCIIVLAVPVAAIAYLFMANNSKPVKPHWLLD